MRGENADFIKGISLFAQYTAHRGFSRLKHFSPFYSGYRFLGPSISPSIIVGPPQFFRSKSTKARFFTGNRDWTYQTKTFKNPRFYLAFLCFLLGLLQIFLWFFKSHVNTPTLAYHAHNL